MWEIAPASRPDSSQVSRKYATERFVEIARRCVVSPEDPKTVQQVARIGGTTRSPFSTLCKSLGLAPHDARDFIRLFRAFVITGGTLDEPHDVLSIAEPKTLEGLFSRAGLPYPVKLSPLKFLDRQRLVRNRHVLEELRNIRRDSD